jgi:hypothetical protein
MWWRRFLTKSLLLTQLGQQISLISLSADKTCRLFIYGHALTYKLIREALCFFFVEEPGSVVFAITVSTDIASAFHWEPYHRSCILSLNVPPLAKPGGRHYTTLNAKYQLGPISTIHLGIPIRDCNFDILALS